MPEKIVSHDTAQSAPSNLDVNLVFNDPTLCSDCPPVGWHTDQTRCGSCPRNASPVEVAPHPSTPAKTPNWVCTECGSVYMESEILVALNPFQLWEAIYGCPACRELNSFAECCDEEGCETPSAAGWNSPSGYRRTCNQHALCYSIDAPPFDSHEVAG